MLARTVRTGRHETKSARPEKKFAALTLEHYNQGEHRFQWAFLVDPNQHCANTRLQHAVSGIINLLFRCPNSSDSIATPLWRAA